MPKIHQIMAEELQEESILVGTLSTIVSRTESISSDPVTLDIKVNKENIPPSTVVSEHEEDSEQIANTQTANKFEESLQKCYNGNHHISSWEELQEDLQVVLPNSPQFTYIIESFKQMPYEKFSGAPKYAFELQGHINIFTADQAKEWLSQMFSHSKCTYRHTRGRKSKCKKVLYKAYMHCQHQKKALTPKQEQKPKKLQKRHPFLETVRNKKTGCPSVLMLTVKIPSDKAKAMTPLNALKISHPTIIKISFNHNHPIDSAHALSFRPVALHVKEAYYQLFKTGHSAVTARHTYETRIMLENDEEDVMHVLSDRAVNPNPLDVSRLFAEWRSHNLGPENGIEMFDKLDALIHDYNLQHSKDGGKIVLQKYSDAYHSEVQSDDDQSGDDQEPPCKKRKKESSPLSIVICTPLMARVHQYIPQAGEIAYIDSTSSLDRYNLSMFVISTSNSGGGLPLGLLITSDEKASTLERSFACFCKVLPDFAFFNQGPSNGPNVFMSDDSLSQSQAISATWPNTKQLLCVFHVLQSFWTWLHDGKNKVQAIHRQSLMLKIKDLVYAKSEKQLAERFDQLLKDSTAVMYPRFIQHVNSYWSRRHMWVICFRQHLLIRVPN